MNGIFQTKLQTSSLALVGNTYVSKVCVLYLNKALQYFVPD